MSLDTKRNNFPNALAICAPSGTGKTTFLCALIKKILLRDNNHSTEDIVVLKMSHHKIAEDSRGKDCQKYRDMGILAKATQDLHEAYAFLQDHRDKICFIEGGRRLHLPSIVLHRKNKPHDNWQYPQKTLMVVEL